MSSTLIQHADVITLDPDGTILSDASVAIRDGVIVGVGEAPGGFGPDETIDATDHILMPGFANAHTHAAMTLVRGWAEDLPLDKWFNDRIWRAESVLTSDDVYWGAALAAAEMIHGGTVAFADHYFYMDRVGELVTECGLRANLAWCAFGLESGEIGTDLQGISRFVEEWQGRGDGRIRTVLGPHSPYLCSQQFLARTAAVAARLGVGIHIHLAETAEQVRQSLEKHDLTPVEVLNRCGVLDVPVIAAHAIHLSPHDIEILAQSDVTVVQCPTCHMKLGFGVTQVPQLLAAGVGVALGTDGPASNNSLSMQLEARHAVLSRRYARGDPVAMPGDLPLRLATQAGLRALGFPLSGEIAVNHDADLILIDCRTPRMRPRHDLVAQVIHAAESGDVSDVMVAGRWLMRDRQLLTMDEKRIMREAEQRGKEMVSKSLRLLRSYE
jgi:5-methylthioadenosine/S-adenosylhomocysteine deaminase